MTPPPDARERFLDHMRRPEDGLELARAALLVAAEAEPALDVEAHLATLGGWGATLATRLEPGWNNLQRLARLRAFVYDELGFRGDTRDYFAPENSLLHEVLRRRQGVPLTLAIVMLELGWRIGMPLEGVGFPGHFLVRLTGEPRDLVLDPFEHGRSMHEDDLRRILGSTTQGTVAFGPELLASVGKRSMIVRLLHNLKNAHVRRGEDAGALAAVERLLALQPEDAGQRRDRGLLLVRLNRHREALTALLDYLEHAPRALDHDDVARHVMELRGILSSLN
jgi:regulator of sirC expression with transglutaminase-like and TPR domain